MSEVQERITSFWSLVASGYEAHAGNVPARGGAEYAAWVRLFADLLPAAPADVLDVATGTGFVAHIAAGLGHRVTGIDLSEGMLAEAKAAAARDGLTMDFKLEDAVAPTLAPHSYDALTNRNLIWTLRDLETALASWRNLLRPGGRLIAIDGFRRMPDPDANSGPFVASYTPETRAALSGWRHDGPEAIAALAEAAGFKDVAVRALDDIHRVSEAPSDNPARVLTARA